jgi:hypothetical protein
MKTLIRFMWMTRALSCFLLLASCDDEPERLPNQLIMNSKTYSFARGYISEDNVDNDDKGNSGRWYTVGLTSSNLTISSSGMAVGNGNMLIIELFSASSSVLQPGTYSIDGELVGTATSLFVTGMVNNWEKVDNIYFATEGFVKVTRQGNDYKLEFKFTLVDGIKGDEKEASGSFQGPLTLIKY